MVTRPNTGSNTEVVKPQVFDRSSKGFWIHYSIQVIYKNKNERRSSQKIDSVDTIVCVERIGRFLKRKHLGEFREKKPEI